MCDFLFLLMMIRVAFASPDIAEQLAGSVTGTVLPFSFNPQLELLVDPSLLEHNELYFNAARLDRSLVLKTSDYIALAKPRLGRITDSRGTSQQNNTLDNKNSPRYTSFREISMDGKENKKD